MRTCKTQNVVSTLHRIVLIWQDNRFVDGNFTEDEALNCFPGMFRPEQVDEVWKPDIFLEGTMDGVKISALKRPIQ